MLGDQYNMTGGFPGTEVPCGRLAFCPEGTFTAATGAPEDIRTIFVLGFPPDVKEREFWNLIKSWPGYEACMMDLKGDQPLGFARFQTAALAQAAMDRIQNVVLDEDGLLKVKLRAEMARKNLYLKSFTGSQNGSRSRSGGDFHSPPPSPPRLVKQMPPMHPHHAFPQPPVNSTDALTPYMTQQYQYMVSTGFTPMVGPWNLPSTPITMQTFAVPPQTFSVPQTFTVPHQTFSVPAQPFPMQSLAIHPSSISFPYNYSQQPPPMGSSPFTIGYPIYGSQQVPPTAPGPVGLQAPGYCYQPAICSPLQSECDSSSSRTSALIALPVK